jgi:Glyoxalase/Bleomycin resistance protein/Dioxygenase superfamily
VTDTPQTAHGERTPLVDHIAIEVDAIDRRVAALTATGALRVLREGRQHSTGQRIFMLGDGTGFKIELIESQQPAVSFAHVALRVSDVEAAEAMLVDQGWTPRRPPHDLPAAGARTALLSDGSLDLQVIAYQPGSPDMLRWSDTPAPPPSLITGPVDSSRP